MSDYKEIEPKVGGNYYIKCHTLEKGPQYVKLHCEQVFQSRYNGSSLAIFAFWWRFRWNYKCELTPVGAYEKGEKTVLMV